MITRADVYAKEAGELLRVLTLYKVLDERQIFRLFPGKEDSIKVLLSGLIKQKRIAYNPDSGQLSAGSEISDTPDQSVIAAFWVLLDFIEKTDYHTTGEYPVKINFFSIDGEFFEIIHVPAGNEIIINHALSAGENDGTVKRIIIVDRLSQIPDIKISGTVAICTVSNDGAVDYYKAT